MEDRIWYLSNGLVGPIRGRAVYKHFPNWEAINKYVDQNPQFNAEWIYLGATPWSFQNKTWDELSPQLKAEWIASDYQCPELITKVFWPAIEELEKQCRDFEETVMKLSDKIWNLENPDALDDWEEVGDPVEMEAPPAHNHGVEFDLPDPQQDL